MSHPTSAVHELGGYLNYAENGLSPYWQLVKLVTNAYNGGGSTAIELDGTEWDVSVGYQYGNIKPDPDDNISSDGLLEIRITAHDHLRKLPLLIQPRRAGMVNYETGERIHTPFDRDSQPDEGVAVRIDNGVNIEPGEYPRLVPKILTALMRDAGLGWNSRYLTKQLPTSNIYAYERYLRVLREMAKKVVRGDGIMARVARLCASEAGSRGKFEWNNDGIVGYQTKLHLSRADVRQLIPDHRYGKKIEHYHPEHVRDGEHEDDPLYHPKFEAKMQKNLNGGSVPWHEHKRLTRELEETLINLLAWARVPTRPGHPFISDDYFDASNESDIDIARYDDPTHELERRQDSVLIRTLTAIRENDKQVLHAMTDGGEEMHPKEIASETDLSTSTVYRALKRMEGLVTNENASVDFASVKLRQDVEEIVSRTDDLLTNEALRVAELLHMDPETLSQQGSAFQQWLTKYGADLVESGGDLRVKITATVSRYKGTSAPWIADVLDEGAVAWSRSGRRMHEFEELALDVGGAIVGARYPRIRTVLQKNKSR